MNTTQTIVAVGMVIFVLMVALQFALSWHAKQIVEAAADQGAHAAAAAGATAGDGEAAARGFVRQVGYLSGVDVSVSSTGGSMVVQVSGESPKLVAAVPLQVVGAASAPIEAPEPITSR